MPSPSEQRARMLRKRTIAKISLLCMLCGEVAVAAPAQPPSAEPSSDVSKARDLFRRGAALVQAAQWAEALAAFEQSSELRPHPITTYNIGACERALGRYTVARATLQRALVDDSSDNGKLPGSLRAEAKGYIAEIERVLVHVDLTVAPTDAALAVDGRPLAAFVAPGVGRELVAGLREPGHGEVVPAGQGALVLDPGTHLLTLSRKGFSDQLVTKTFKPGSRHSLTLNLDKLPARLLVSSNEQKSRVRIDLFDVGYAPVDVERPSGPYSVTVEKPGFVSYQTTINVNPGEAADIKATLLQTPITQKWWFWTAAGVLVTGAVVGTYFITRSEPAAQRPPLDGGGFSWAVQVP